MALDGDRRVVVLQKFCVDTINVKVRLPNFAYARDKYGEFLRAPMQVDSVHVQVVVMNGADKQVYKARSCCKPPDMFNVTMGTKLALKRIFSQDQEKVVLSKKDRTDIMKICCPGLFGKAKKSSKRQDQPTLFPDLDEN